MTEPIARLTAALADRYRLERELGQGGMATVYLAQDLKHDRRVAIKVLRPELAAVIGAERFLSEIRTTANLQHPHILPLFDSGATTSHLERGEGSGGIAKSRIWTGSWASRWDGRASSGFGARSMKNGSAIRSRQRRDRST
jgi:hypothetical protein